MKLVKMALVVLAIMATTASMASAQVIIIGGGGGVVIPGGGGGGPANATVSAGSSSVMPGVILGGIGAFLTYRAVVCAINAQKYGTTFNPKRGYEVQGGGRGGCNNDAYHGSPDGLQKPWAPF